MDVFHIQISFKLQAFNRLGEIELDKVVHRIHGRLVRTADEIEIVVLHPDHEIVVLHGILQLLAALVGGDSHHNGNRTAVDAIHIVVIERNIHAAGLLDGLPKVNRRVDDLRTCAFPAHNRIGTAG